MSAEIKQPNKGSDNPLRFTPRQGSGVKRERNRQGGFKRAIRLTEQVESEILLQLRRGSHLETAFALARIPGQTYRAWLSQARESLDKVQRGEYITERRKKLIRFLAKVEQAQAQAEQRLIMSVQDAANSGQWQAAVALLERRHPEKWAKQQAGDINVNVAVGFGYVEIVPSEQRSVNQLPGSPVPESRQLEQGDPSTDTPQE